MFKDRSLAHLPIGTWLTFEDAMVGLLLSSFIINLLGLVFPICVLQFYDRVIPNRSTGTLAAMVCLILVALIFEVIMKILRGYVSSWTTARFTYNTGKRLFNRIVDADISEIEETTAGVYLDKYNSAESMRDHYCGQNLIMLVDLPFIFVYLGLMFIINKYIAMVPCVIMIIMFFTALSAGNRAFKHLEKKSKISEIKSKFLFEMLSGIHTIKSMGMEEQFLRRYERLHEGEINNNYDLIQRSSESSRTGNFFSQLTIIFTVCVGAILVIKHQVTVGGLAASILLVGKAMLPVSKVVMYIEKNRNLQIARDDFEYIMDLEPEYSEDLPDLEQITGAIEFKNVSFKYEHGDHYVLKDINLTINANEVIVFHGEGFSGKSTMMLLIDGILKPQEGDIYIDGIDLRSVNLESYRRQVAFMSEGGELFAGSIIDNMTMFNKENYGTRAKEISKALGLHDIIESMPNAYATEVGTGTIDILSRGHKQLILIVRALLDDPQILIFDEANLSLDIDSDIKLRKYMLSLKGKKTLIMVTHRPSILEMADKHYKLSDGRIEEFKWK